MKLTCPNCGRVHPLGEPYPQPGGRILCGCGRKLAVRYPTGALERLRAQGAKFLDESPPVRPTAPGRTLMPVESQNEPRKGWNLTEDEEATTLFRSEEIEVGLPPARPPIRHEEPPARRPTTLTPVGLQMRQRARTGPLQRDDAPTLLVPSPEPTAETEEAPPVRPPSSLEPIASPSGAVPMPTLVPETSISIPIKPKLSRATVDGPRPSRGSDLILVERAGGPHMPDAATRDVHVVLPDGATTTPPPPPPVVPYPASSALEPMAAADPAGAARALPTGDTTNTEARRGATLDEIQRLRVPVEAPKTPTAQATGAGKVLLAVGVVVLLLVLAGIGLGLWALSNS